MNVLVINYFYPPTVDAHAYRWEQIARFLVKDGHRVDVITGKICGRPRHSVEFGVQVTRVGLATKPSPTLPMRRKGYSPASWLRGRVLDGLRPIYRKVYWPDSMWHWVPSVICEVIRRRHVNYDLIVSYYPCLAAHLAAALLKSVSTNPRVVWIADYGDPFCASPTMQPNNYRLYNQLNRLAEGRLAKMANHVVFTNEATAEAYKLRLPINQEVAVIPHLVNIASYYGDVAAKYCESRTATLYFIGGFHRSIREPNRLYNLIRRLNKLGTRKYVLEVYGPLNGYRTSDLSPADCPEIKYMGMVERNRATELLKHSEVIVNVDNLNCIMTPSKIVECISTGRPIINISNDGVNYEPLKQYAELGYALPLVESPLSDASVLRAAGFIDRHRGGACASRSVIDRILAEHTTEAVVNRYLSLIGLEMGS